jgi:predicted DNA-binding protein YlxM (UPF0122 family)
MKRKQVVLDHIEDMDNHLLAMERALTIPTVTREAIENYIRMTRERLKEVENFVKLEDNG